MKFKKIISIAMSAIITAVSASTFSGTLVNRSIFNASAEVDTEANYDSWQEAYRYILVDFMEGNVYKNMASDNLYYSFLVKDLSSDGIPELFLCSPQSTMPSYLYTFYNNRIKPLGGFIKGGDISYCPNENIVIASGGTAGYVYYKAFRIQNGEIVMIDDLFYGTNYQTRNGVEITRQEYTATVQKYQAIEDDDYTKDRLQLDDENLYMCADLSPNYSSWQEAYKSLLTDYMRLESFDSSLARYELYDVDSNGTPELFVSGGTYHYADLYLYTFANNRLVDIAEGNVTGANGSAYIVPTKSYVYFKGGNQGSYWTIVCEVNDDTLIIVATFEDTSAAISAEYYGYKFNGKKVTKSQYTSYLEQYTSDYIGDIGRDRKFDNINSDFVITTTTTRKTTTTTKKTTTTTTTTRKTTTTTKKTTTTTKKATTTTTTANYSYADAGPAEGDLSYFDKFDADKATVKPILYLSRIELSVEEARSNPTQTITLSIKNADNEYCGGGIRVNWDNRLSAGGEDKAVKGAALTKLEVMFGGGNNELFTAFTSADNDGKDGVMCSFPLTIPSDCKPGDVYPIQIKYVNGDQFIRRPFYDEQYYLIEAWVFTQGIVQGYIKITGEEPITSNISTITTTNKTTTTSQKLTTTTTSSNVSKVLYGDANCDTQVDMSDVVLVMQSLANPNKYGLNGTDKNHITEQGQLNGDVDISIKGITSNDALRIQLFLLDIINTLDYHK